MDEVRAPRWGRRWTFRHVVGTAAMSVLSDGDFITDPNKIDAIRSAATMAGDRPLRFSEEGHVIGSSGTCFTCRVAQW